MYLTINSKFRPFTYDEMVKPLAQYKEVYDKLEQDYSDLTAQTEMWKDVANQTNSPEAYEMYQRYSNDLASVVDSFSKGMNINNRKALLNMKRRYAQDIAPIAKADAAMKEANELRIKAGPDAIFEVGEYNSLDDFLHGKTANNKYQSREALTKKTASMTEAAMAEALKDPEFKKAMGDQYWLISQHTGGSYEDLMEAMKLGMLDNPIAQNRFSEIRQRVAKESGIANYDYQGQQAIMDAIDTGLYAGLDKPVRNFQANQDHITPYQGMNLSLSAANAGMEWDKEKGEWVYNPNNDPTLYRAATKSTRGSSRGGSSSMTGRANRLKSAIKVRVTNKGGGSGTYEVGATEDVDVEKGLSKYNAISKSYSELTQAQKMVVDRVIGNDSKDGYEYYITTEDAKRLGTGDDDFVIIRPKTSVLIDDTETNQSSSDPAISNAIPK